MSPWDRSAPTADELDVPLRDELARYSGGRSAEISASEGADEPARPESAGSRPLLDGIERRR